MSEFTNYFKNTIINHLFRNQAFTPPATIYLGLYTVAPTDAGGGTEVSGGGYARQSFSLTDPANGIAKNLTHIIFPTATANWGTIVAVGIFDAFTDGNLLMWSPFDVAKAVDSGYTFQINTGNLSVIID